MVLLQTPSQNANGAVDATPPGATHSTPAWVVCDNTLDMWQGGLEDEDIPDDLKLTEQTVRQIMALRRWAATSGAQQVPEAKRQALESRVRPQLAPLLLPTTNQRAPSSSCGVKLTSDGCVPRGGTTRLHFDPSCLGPWSSSM